MYIWALRNEASQRGAFLSRDVAQTIRKNGLRCPDDVERLAQQLDLAALCHQSSKKQLVVLPLSQRG